MSDKKLWVTSMYGSKSRQPLVNLAMPGGEFVQMSPEEARDLALNLLQGAEAAEQDGFIVEFALDEMKQDEPHAAMFLDSFRRWREKRAKHD